MTVEFGRTAAVGTPGEMFTSIRDANNILTGQRPNMASQDVTSFSHQGSSNKKSLLSKLTPENLLKGALAIGAAVLGFKFFKGRGAKKAAEAVVK